MFSERVVSDNILKLRELTNKYNIIDYFDIVCEVRELISASKDAMVLEKSKDKKIRLYEQMVAKIDAMVNQNKEPWL